MKIVDSIRFIVFELLCILLMVLVPVGVLVAYELDTSNPIESYVLESKIYSVNKADNPDIVYYMVFLKDGTNDVNILVSSSEYPELSVGDCVTLYVNRGRVFDRYSLID